MSSPYPGQGGQAQAGNVVPNASPIGSTGNAPDDQEDVQGEARAVLNKFLARIKQAVTEIVAKDPRMAKLIAQAVSNAIQDGILKARSSMGAKGEQVSSPPSTQRPGLKPVGPSSLFGGQ